MRKVSVGSGDNSAGHACWVRFRQNTHAKIRIFCFPFAGGNANYFNHWALHLQPDFEVFALQQPGKGQRTVEKPYTKMGDLLEELQLHTGALMDRPSVFFGHSMGAWVAYELTRRLAEKPDHLILSAADPGLRPKALPVHLMNDDQLLAEMELLGGTPQEILDDVSFFKQFFPMIRADFKMLETHVPGTSEPLSLPASIWSGARDPRVAPAVAHGWVNKFSYSVRHKTFAGGHMFIGPNESGERCLAEIQQIATPLLERNSDYLAVC